MAHGLTQRSYKVGRLAIMILIATFFRLDQQQPIAIANGQQIYDDGLDSIRQDSGAQTNQTKCRVLSLAGGGAKGAYEVGALQTLASMLEYPESHYDVVSGVSVGSINAAGTGLFGPGEDKEMADFLVSLWNNLHNDKVWRFWNSSNPIAGLTDKAGFLDNQPLHNLIVDIVESRNMTYKKKVIVSANDANTGHYIEFKLNELNSSDEIASAVTGSAAVPFFFEPQNMSRYGMDHLMVDAGFDWNINLESGIKECRKMPGIYNDSQIIVDVINLSPDTLSPYVNFTLEQEADKKYTKCQKMLAAGEDNLTNVCGISVVPPALRNYLRKGSIHSAFNDLRNVGDFMDVNSNVTYRYFLSPETDLMEDYVMLDFEPDNTLPVIQRGRDDMRKVIEMGPGKSYEKVRNLTKNATKLSKPRTLTPLQKQKKQIIE